MDVLVYSGDGELVEALREALGDEYRVRSAPTERQLQSAFASGRAGAVILDGKAPRVAAMCLWLRMGAEVPIVAIAAGDQVAERVRLLRAGADDVLKRSFQPAELVARLNAKLRRTELEQRRRAARLPHTPLGCAADRAVL
ncbi:MAG TPA: response regulator [Roseiflexaceae bacterium]